MISAIHQRAKVLGNTSYDNKTVNQAQVFVRLKQRVFHQFRARYAKHYLIHVFTKDELIGMKKTRIPSLYEKHKIEELVLNKRSHFNALFKEVTLLTLPYLSFTRLYNKMEQLCVLTNLMLLPKEFPPNLFPSGKKILNIIDNRQMLLLHNANRRFEELKRRWKTIEVKSSKKKQTETIPHSYKEEQFKLADISLSIDDNKDDFFQFYFKKGIYSSQHNNLSKKDTKQMNIQEIEFLINEITKQEEKIEKQKNETRSRYNKVLSIKTIKSKRHKELSNQYSTEKVLVTSMNTPKAEQYLATTGSSAYHPRTITIERNPRKFKSVAQFISIGHYAEKKEQNKKLLMNDLVVLFNQRKENHSNKKNRGNVRAIPHFNTLNTSTNEKTYLKESSLHFKTQKLFRNIELFNHSQRDTIINGFNFEQKKKFPMIYSKNIIQSQRNQMKRFFLDKAIEKKVTKTNKKV